LGQKKGLRAMRLVSSTDNLSPCEWIRSCFLPFASGKPFLVNQTRAIKSKQKLRRNPIAPNSLQPHQKRRADSGERKRKINEGNRGKARSGNFSMSKKGFSKS
jgi:hypothetical protein